MTKVGNYSHGGKVTGPLNGTHCQYPIVIPFVVKLKKPCSKGESLHILGKQSQNGDKAGGLTKTLQMSFSKQPFKRSLIWKLNWGVCVSVQLCLMLWDPMDYSSPGSSVHRIFQARILEKVAIFSSRGSPQPRHRTHTSCVSCIGRQILYQLHHLRKWSIITVSPFLEHRGRTSGLLRQKARSVHWVLKMPESQENFWDTCIYKSLSGDSLGITNQDDLKSVWNVWLQGLSTAPRV